MNRTSWFVAALLAAGALAAISVLGLTADPAEVDPPPAFADPTQDSDKEADHYWPQWRGPLGTGYAPHADPPVKWSEEQNIRWKVKLPGKGHSTPVIWGDRIFVTTAIATGDPVRPSAGTSHGDHDNLASVRRQKFVVLAVNRRDGKIIWQKTVREHTPHEGGHNTGSFASNSPVTDGEHLIASFGSNGLFCLDLDGELQWEKDLGDLQTKHGHGEGSSPALHDNTVIVNWDHEGASFVIALDKRTGDELWKVARDEVSSWSSPLVVMHRGKPQVIINGTRRIRAYELATGRIIWECGGLSHNVVASPVAANGMVYAGSSYEKKALLAIRLDGARGDITGTDQVVWSRDRRTSYVPSPLLFDESLFFLQHYQGILSCLNAKTGEARYRPFRLSGVANVYASLAGADGRVYITSLNGSTLVLKHGKEPKVLAVNRLDDRFSASPVMVGGELFLRGEQHLYAVQEKPKPEWPSYHGDYTLTGLAEATVPDKPALLWKFKAGNFVEHTPVVGDGRIYFTTEKAELFALDMKGGQVWKIDIKPDTFTAPPLYANKLVIVGTQKGHLTAFHTDSGKEKWSYDVEDNIMGSANRVDLKDGKKGIVVTAQATGAIHCVDLETGKGVWKTEEIDRTDGSASVGGGRIVMGSCASALHVFSVEKAEKTADIPLGAECQVAGGVALSGNMAFAGTRSGSVCAVDVTTGKVIWTNEDNESEAFTTPAVNEEFVIFAADDGIVYALDRKTGKKAWEYDTKKLPTSPVIAGNRVIVAAGGDLLLLDLKDGRKVWSARVSDELTSPAVVGGMMIVGADDGTVTAYGRK